MLNVSEVHNVLGWFWNNSLRVETRTTYQYDKGNNVTVVQHRDYHIQMYDQKGNLENHNNRHSIDVKA